MGLKNLLVQLLVAAPLGLAHPQDAVPHWKTVKRIEVPKEKRGMSHCKAQFEHPEFMKRTIQRRMEEVANLKRERNLEHEPNLYRRQTNSNAAKVLATDHKVTAYINGTSDPRNFFGDTGSCVLDPEVTEGPLYVRGEEIRRDVTEGEGGVRTRLHIQVVNYQTCQPIPNVWVDLWSCNTTGVYGGVLNYPGNGDPNDLSVINATAMRGIQPTDQDGIAIFDTVVPGHYSGRANHLHALVHHDATRQPNGTITGGRVSHVGQMYFDQSFLMDVEATHPYNTNHQQWTYNRADMLFTMGTSNGDDPVVRYAQLSNDLADGILGWIRFGIDPSASRNYNPAAYLDANGGHQLAGGFGPPIGGGFGGFPGFGGGFGGFPKDKKREDKAEDKEE